MEDKNITFEDLPKAMSWMMDKLNKLDSKIDGLNNIPQIRPADQWMNQGERSITCTSYYSLYFFNPNDFISYFLVPSTRFPLSCHSQFDIALF